MESLASTELVPAEHRKTLLELTLRATVDKMMPTLVQKALSSEGTGHNIVELCARRLFNDWIPYDLAKRVFEALVCKGDGGTPVYPDMRTACTAYAAELATLTLWVEAFVDDSSLVAPPADVRYVPGHTDDDPTLTTLPVLYGMEPGEASLLVPIGPLLLRNEIAARSATSGVVTLFPSASYDDLRVAWAHGETPHKVAGVPIARSPAAATSTGHHY